MKTKLSLVLSCCWLVLSLGACSDDVVGDGLDQGAELTEDRGDDFEDQPDVPSDRGTVDAPDQSGPTCPPATGAFGAPCQSNQDCHSSICLPDGPDGICTTLCLRTCEPLCDGRETFCRGFTLDDGDLAFVCRPPETALCQGCVADAQCEGGRCLSFEDGLDACGLDCEDESQCPDGFSCGGSNPAQAGQCLPISGTCSCTPEHLGLVRPCHNANQWGACFGTQTCLSDGWTHCDAEVPAQEECNALDDDCDGIIDNNLPVGEPCYNESPGVLCDAEPCRCEGIQICLGFEGMLCYGQVPSQEICDYHDNNCNGLIDEDFTDAEGRYTDFHNCGFCGNSCEGRFDMASEVICATDRPTPECVIVECLPGLQRVSESMCMPFQPNYCDPCESDQDCSTFSPGGACVEITEVADPASSSMICGRDCTPDSVFGSECPVGFSCSEFDRGSELGVIHQCVPTSGSCICVNNPVGFTIPCRVTIEDGELDLHGARGEVTCPGTKSCVDGDFGECVLYGEVCDGIDNNCSGRIDDPFRDEEGRYVEQNHCGRCNNDCDMINYPNATTSCKLVDGIPTCQMVCIDDPGGLGVFRDVFNGTDDGCECELLSEDDVPNGVDANCDGVDGNISLALFVSKIGSPDGSGTRRDPLDSIQAAIDLASLPESGIRDVYVASGVYSENLRLANGINLYGGYSLDFFQRDPDSNPTTIFGLPPDHEAFEFGTLNAILIERPTTVSGFSIYGFNATEPGASSYAVYLRDCGEGLVLEGNEIFAANGSDGLQGAPGSSGLLGGDGQAGGLGRSTAQMSCLEVASTAGGLGGDAWCGSLGGDGGTAHCPIASQDEEGLLPCDHESPESCLNHCPSRTESTPLPPSQGLGERGLGNDLLDLCLGDGCGVGGGPTYDFWSNLGSCHACALQECLAHIGRPGQTGRTGHHGSGGLGCALEDQHGYVTADGLWMGAAGSNGLNDATHGGGGGGGSAGAGYDVVPSVDGGPECTDTIGGSGGGGGGGGCSGTSGAGGTGGGSSFGVFIYYSGLLIDSQPVIVNTTFYQGRGGSGGPGGAGGAGGRGGLGGEGGFTYPVQAFCSSPGGPGGSGGAGGVGGGGGGGCGGNAYSIFVYANGNLVSEDQYLAPWADNWFVNDGTPGFGGRGGTSTVLTSYGGDGYEAAEPFDSLLVP